VARVLCSLAVTSDEEVALRACIRGELPTEAFRRRPWRILLGVPIVLVIVGASAMLLAVPLPWYAAIPVLAVLSNAYVTLMFFGHEVAHGAMVRSRRVQDAVLVVTCAVFLVSSHLWRHWHNRWHHGATNIPGVDPDPYRSLEEVDGASPLRRWLLIRIAPGSGHWLSALYLPIAFTIHGQLMLWAASRGWRQGFRWRRAVVETALVAAFWLVVGVAVGPAGAALVVLLPMLAANAIVMSYVTTNHMFRPLSREVDTLGTTMSVTTLGWLDRVHLHFSHHTEHHLFPAVSHRYYPLVRTSLLRHAPERFLAPPHWRALIALYRTPKFYADDRTVINPLTGRRLTLAAVEASLRRTSAAPAVVVAPVGQDAS
jgi:fatty acid desaturase